MESERQKHFQKKTVISRLNVALKLVGVFGFFHHLQLLTSAQLVQRLANLVKSHPENLEASLCDEFVHFSERLKTEIAADVAAKQDLLELKMYRAIRKNLHPSTAFSTWWCSPRPRLVWVEMAVDLPEGPSYPRHSPSFFRCAAA